jgi:hypothetical protein
VARALISIAAVAVAGVVGVSSQPPVDRIVVIIDADSPVENVAVADRIRGAALGGAEMDALVFQLTSLGVQFVPDRDTAVDGIPFAFQPRTYNGVTLNISEASEILRNNEAVRDAVINRGCQGDAAGCGGAVHAAAIALIHDTEEDTAGKIRRVIEVCRTTRPRTVILITAGWPYRDPAGLRLDDRARELRALGATLSVWHVPSSISYGALVADASAALATRTSGTLTVLNTERDAQRARTAYVRADPGAGHEPPPSARVPPASGAPPPQTFDDAPDASLRLAASYVARFEETFAAVIWREHYTQEDRAQRRFPASGTRFSQLMSRRELDSELLLVWLPREASWIAVRDVMAVDGVPRPAGERRVQVALQSSDLSVDTLKMLATENGRFNIGQVVRTFNEPTLALLFLDSHYRHRFSFRRIRREPLEARRSSTYEFVERSRPTVIQDRREDVPARGTITIDDATGDVLRTTLELTDAAGSLRGTMTVRYKAHQKFDVLVPVEMLEEYASTTGEHITTVATYTDFRRFETAGRLIGVRDDHH